MALFRVQTDFLYLDILPFRPPGGKTSTDKQQNRAVEAEGKQKLPNIALLGWKTPASGKLRAKFDNFRPFL